MGALIIIIALSFFSWQPLFNPGFFTFHDEQQVARFLHKHKINTSYESEVLNLDGQICVPDFFLTDYEVYIEYYGGFPGSWKKKVIKNKLYRKYSVPVIAVTPAELKNLDAAILWELRREFGKGSM